MRRAWFVLVVVALVGALALGTSACGLEDKFKDPVVKEIEVDVG